MPIYCLNSSKSTRKKSQNMIQDLIGCDNYYLTGRPQNLSAASNQILQSKRRHRRSLETCSLQIHIENFKNSVMNMRETVLVPMRLNDMEMKVESSSSTNSDSGIDNFDPIASDGVSCCSSLSEQSSLEAHSNSDAASIASSNSSISSLETSMIQHCSYDQFKLINLIDSILDADNTAALQSHYRTLSSKSLLAESLVDSGGRYGFALSTITPTPSIGQVSSSNSGSATTTAATTTTMTTASTMAGGRITRTSVGSTSSEEDEGISSPGDMGDNDCALVKIKEKFQHHLLNLKSILQLMTNCAETLTQKYLEDIQCDDRFDNSSCTPTIGNSATAVAATTNNSSSISSAALSGSLLSTYELKDNNAHQTRQYFTSNQVGLDH